MSNILIIKHGSLGDISQISGALRDIKENYNNKKIFILTTLPYVELLSKCPYVDGVLIDKRIPRWNFLYLIRLKKLLKKFNFIKVYDLQNSSRTSFYNRYVFKIFDWNSAETTSKMERKKNEFNKNSVLERFKFQLEKSKIQTKYCLKPDFSWACKSVNQIINKYFGKKFILIFPFCSPQLPHKKWPYFNQLIKIIKSKNTNLEIAMAPGPNEIGESNLIEAVSITNNEKSLNIMELAGLISKADYVISNDTGPAHIAAHLDKEGVVLFGHHTTPKKVSIETDKFKSISVHNLRDLSAEEVYSKIKSKIELINQL